jgi:hypothetical protein
MRRQKVLEKIKVRKTWANHDSLVSLLQEDVRLKGELVTKAEGGELIDYSGIVLDEVD